MPLLDVTDVLFDPDFATTFSVIRTATTAAGGLAVLTTATIQGISGVVQPASSTELLRMPDAERIGGAITVRTNYVLIAGDGAHTADIIVLTNGEQYTVQSIQDWTAYGSGYVEALCSKLNIR